MREELLTLLKLKQLARTGWVRAGVENPESVADHSWGMAILALRLCPQELDLCKVLSMCIMHDVAEILVGDLTPHDEIKGKEKHDLERAAMNKIAPQWISQITSYVGWGRGREPSYNIAKVDLITTISTSWRLRITFSHSPAPKNKNNHLKFSLSLIRK